MHISMIALTLAVIAFCVLDQANAGPSKSVNCSLLKENIKQPRWLSLPNSRIVINPAEAPQHPVHEYVGDSLPLNLAYYCGERPVRLPSFWAWKPADAEADEDSVSVPLDAEKWTPRALEAVFKSNQACLRLADEGYGEITAQVTIDLDQTPCLCVEVTKAEGAMWAVKLSAEEDAEDVCLIRDTSRTGRFVVNAAASTGLNGKRTLFLKLFAVGKPDTSVTFSYVAFKPSNGSGTEKTTWWPHQSVAKARIASSEVEVTTLMPDESTVAQLLHVKEPGSGTLLFTGQFVDGRLEWDADRHVLVVRHDRFHYVIALSRPATFLPQPTQGVWALEVDGVKQGDQIVAVGRFAPNGDMLSGTIASARAAASLPAFSDAQNRNMAMWDDLLSRVPQPLDFNLYLLKRPEATAESMQRSYYRAWVFFLCDTLPPMPENGYHYPQVACGKPSLWDEGHPKARPSCQWESFIAMQFLAELEPDATWDAFEGMMSLVDAEGTLGGEGLPSRHVQTAWVLYQATKDKGRLKDVYPPLKRMLLWKARDPRWIFKGERPENQWDSEFVVHALLDMLYAKRICTALDMPDEVRFWQEQIEKLSANYKKWFWKERGGTTYWLYQADKDERYQPDHSWCLQGLALPPGILEEPERESLLKLLRSHFRDEIPFLIKGLNKHPTFNLAMRGAWRYGTPKEVARMAEAVMSTIAMADEFGECYTDWFPVKTWGVAPSVFGAANAIDTTLWHNGVMMGDGYPVIVRLPNAAGVRGLRLNGKTLNITFGQDDAIELTGDALATLRVPEGFIALKLADGTPCWTGKLAEGRQLALEDAV